MIAVELLALVPDDDEVYDQFYRACLAEGLAPAHAAVQAYYDQRYSAGNPARHRHRKDA